MNPYSSVYHEPVLCKAVVNGLVGNPDGCYVDATLGGGGHSAAILDALGPAGSIIGIDQDQEAIREASSRLAEHLETGRLKICQGNFANLEFLLEELDVTQIDGILLDLGVSSHQFDSGERGFSHRFDGPLDMRMDAASGESAADLLSRLDANAVARLLRQYGEEPRAWKIAQAVAASDALSTTSELVELVEKVVPQRDRAKTLARVFQAIRIAVNQELPVLESSLEASTRLVRSGGHIAVISYHSLEDRRVKRFLRFGNLEGQAKRDFHGNLIAPWTPVNRRPIVPDDQEIASNPRARSARLRLAIRQPHRPPNAGTEDKEY